MTRSLIIGLVLTLNALLAIAQQKVKEGTGNNGNLPNKDVMLELKNSNKGLLYMRVLFRITTDASIFSARLSVTTTAPGNLNDTSIVNTALIQSDGTQWLRGGII